MVVVKRLSAYKYPCQACHCYYTSEANLNCHIILARSCHVKYRWMNQMAHAASEIIDNKAQLEHTKVAIANALFRDPCVMARNKWKTLKEIMKDPPHVIGSVLPDPQVAVVITPYRNGRRVTTDGKVTKPITQKPYRPGRKCSKKRQIPQRLPTRSSSRLNTPDITTDTQDASLSSEAESDISQSTPVRKANKSTPKLRKLIGKRTSLSSLESRYREINGDAEYYNLRTPQIRTGNPKSTNS